MSVRICRSKFTALGHVIVCGLMAGNHDTHFGLLWGPWRKNKTRRVAEVWWTR